MGGAPVRARRRSIRALAVAGLVFAAALPGLPPRPARAGDREANEESQRLDRDRREAIRAGCEFLVTKQHPGGSFGDDKAVVAFTALSALALMSEGSTIERGPFSDAIRKAVKYLLGLVEEREKGDSQFPDGYFHRHGDVSSRMHGQGYAILCLASALGGARDAEARRIRAVLTRAVACAEQGQTGTGGWGYDPDPAGDHEGSVTVTVAQGLRAARDAGITVDKGRVERALRYLRHSQKDKPGLPEDGSFKYSVTTERSTYALTAAAVSSFFLFGEYGERSNPRDAVQRGIRYMKKRLPEEIKRREWFYYGNFYAAWAAWQYDGDEPEAGADGFWGPWHRTVYPVLLRERANDGSWSDLYDRFSFGDLLPTTFAVLTLAIPDEQIPIFQR